MIATPKYNGTMRFILFMTAILFLAGMPEAQAQKGSQIKREVKRQRKENARASKRAMKYGRARHLSIQDKATRKRIKKNLRDSKKRNKRLSR